MIHVRDYGSCRNSLGYSELETADNVDTSEFSLSVGPGSVPDHNYIGTEEGLEVVSLHREFPDRKFCFSFSSDPADPDDSTHLVFKRVSQIFIDFHLLAVEKNTTVRLWARLDFSDSCHTPSQV